jgi:hypothetical protein
VVALALGSAAPSRAQEAVVLDHVEAFLVHGTTGTLSRNILDAAKPFETWNTGIGEGEAGEPSDDLLVVAHFKRVGKGRQPHVAMVVTERAKSRVLAQHREVSLPFVDADRAVKALLVEEIACADLDIAVSVGSRTHHTPFRFACDE